MKYGICNEHFPDWSLSETVHILADMGYDGVEITPWTVVDSPLEADQGTLNTVRETIENAGLDVIGVPRVLAAGDSEYHIGHPEASVRDRTGRYLASIVDLCAAIGGSVVIFGSPNQRSVPDGTDSTTVWRNAVETFSDERLLERLEATGVTLCMEPISPAYTNFVTTTIEAIEFAEDVSHPNVGVALDGFHLARESRPATECIHDASGHLEHFHSDGDTGKGAAEGTLEYGPIVGALDDIGYNGYLSLEIHELIFEGEDSTLDPVDTARSSIDYLRSVS
jgi:sugar phosphate isomerase/epimerase